MHEKLKVLRNRIEALDGLAVAYSGGVDSTFLLYTAYNLLGDRTLAITVQSPTFPVWELEMALEFTTRQHIPQLVINLDQFSIAGFADNTINRCYLCKKQYYPQLIELARQRGITVVADGSNADDKKDYRPGMQVLRELGVISPLQEARLTKAEIREMSRELYLPTWNKPEEACLATRIPYGVEITPDKLIVIEEAERYLRELGFRQIRVRHHGQIARIEVAPGEKSRFDDATMEKVHNYVQSLGFAYVTLDLKGYRTGSLNEILNYDGSGKYYG